MHCGAAGFHSGEDAATPSEQGKQHWLVFSQAVLFLNFDYPAARSGVRCLTG
jgi:hypothetical protein